MEEDMEENNRLQEIMNTITLERTKLKKTALTKIVKNITSVTQSFTSAIHTSLNIIKNLQENIIVFDLTRKTLHT